MKKVAGAWLNSPVWRAFINDEKQKRVDAGLGVCPSVGPAHLGFRHTYKDMALEAIGKPQNVRRCFP